MATSHPWLVDANSIKITDFSVSDLESFIISTPEIDLFLSSSDANKYFIVGPKGLGKTLLLKLKNLQLREKGYKVFPEQQLCERLDKIHEHFTYSDVRDLETSRMWEVIWELSLCSWILISCKMPIPDEMKKVFGRATSLSLILGNLLGLGTKGIERLYQKYNQKEIRPMVDSLSDSSYSQLALFIDNVDEALTDHVGESLREKERNYILSDKIWINAQIGLLLLAKRLMQSNPHLKIFHSIRSEAYNEITSAEKIQIGDLCISLKYTKEQIREIFMKNIRETSKDMLVFPKDSNLVKSFVGINKISHRFIKDQAGMPQQEDIFEYIYRHTFGRPREIIVMGQMIYNKKPSERNEGSIQEIVNTVSSTLFEQFRAEIVPYFDIDHFKIFCKDVRKNIFSVLTANRINSHFKKEYGIDDICSYYWNLGLLGIVATDFSDEKFSQNFLPVGQYSLSKNVTPDCEHFLLHPATYSVMAGLLYDVSSFYDLANIVGHGRSFIKPRIPYNKVKYYIQLGLGRDSLSILIPTIYPHKVIAVIVDPTDSNWNELRFAMEFNLNLNGDSFKFDVYRDDFVKSAKDRVFRNWVDGQRSTIFFTNDQNLIEALLNYTSTIGLTDYSNIDFFKNISASLNESQKIVYLCRKIFERSGDSMIQSELEKNFSNWVFRQVLLDRYTYSIIRSMKATALECEVITEKYPGRQVSIHHDQASILPSDVVQRPKTGNEFGLLADEFKLIREGTYQYYKYLKQQGESISDQNSTDKIRLLVQLQIEEMIEHQSQSTLKAVYGKDSKPEIRRDLITQGNDHIQRLNDLFVNQNNYGSAVDVAALKSSNIFLSDNRFYKSIKDVPFYSSSPELVTSFMGDMKIPSLNESYKTVFISYSFRDSKIAKLLASYLLINGVKVDIFELDDPEGTLKNIMAKYVVKNDMMIFLASENSLKSDACHFELENLRKKVSESWVNCLIPVRIDNFVLDVKYDDIPTKHAEAYWENIIFLRKYHIHSLSSFANSTDNFALSNYILNKIVKKYLTHD